MSTREFFADDRDWLSRQPIMRPWKKACERLARKMETWIGDFTGECSEAVVRKPASGYEAYQVRAWRCWRHHWRKAIQDSCHGAADGMALAPSIEPLVRDVVLTEAMLQGSARAIHCFHSRFDDAVRRWAGTEDAVYARDMSWWDDFFSRLIGVPGSLATFDGRAPLGGWLKKVVRNELLRIQQRRARERRMSDLPDDTKLDQIVPAAARSDTGTSAKCNDLLIGLLRDVLAEFEPHVQTAIYEQLVEGLNYSQVADLLRIDKGNVTRLRNRIRDRLEQRMQEIEARSDALGQLLRECVERIFGDPSMCRAFLGQLLKDEQGGES